MSALSPATGSHTQSTRRSPAGAAVERLARSGELRAFEHTGFWQPMDTLREKNLLEDLWQTGQAPWKCW